MCMSMHAHEHVGVNGEETTTRRTSLMTILQPHVLYMISLDISVPFLKLYISKNVECS